jgi:hypothetical protein
MNHEHQIISSQTNGSSVPLPLPRAAVGIRAGTLDDLSFIDGLQRRHTKQVGWMPTMQLEGKIRAGHVLVAEERAGSGQRAAGSEEEEVAGSGQQAAGSADNADLLLPAASCLLFPSGTAWATISILSGMMWGSFIR